MTKTTDAITITLDHPNFDYACTTAQKHANNDDFVKFVSYEYKNGWNVYKFNIDKMETKNNERKTQR